MGTATFQEKYPSTGIYQNTQEAYDYGFTAGAIQERNSRLKVLGILETNYFTFYAFGQTEAEAKKFLKNRWLVHMQQTGATYNWELMKDSCFFIQISRGGFRANDPQLKINN